MNKVFLGGLCKNSTWRDKLIPLLKIDYFNPVVEDWTSERIEIEEYEKEICNILLYVVVEHGTGTYTVAEMIAGSILTPSKTLILCQTDYFKEKEDKSLRQSINLATKFGATVLYDLDLEELAELLNNIG